MAEMANWIVFFSLMLFLVSGFAAIVAVHENVSRVAPLIKLTYIFMGAVLFGVTMRFVVYWDVVCPV